MGYINIRDCDQVCYCSLLIFLEFLTKVMRGGKSLLEGDKDVFLTS